MHKINIIYIYVYLMLNSWTPKEF